MMVFKNAIFQREFMATVRAWKTNFLVWAYLLILAGLLLILWPGSGILSKVSNTSKQIFSLFFCTNLTLLILLVPAFTATSITYEKENRTYAALFTTLMTPLDIMLGKLMSSITMLLLIVVLSMPITSVCALTGGVSTSFMLKVMALIVMTAITYGLLGLFCSTLCERSTSAVLLNYVLILVFAGGTWLPDALLGNLLGLRAIWQYLRSISPYDALFYLLYPENYQMTTQVHRSVMQLNPYQIYIGVSCTVCVTALAIFYYKILRPSSKASGPRGEVFEDTKRAIKRKLTWPFYLFDPLKRKKLIKRFSNPVFVAELRSKLFGNPKFVMRTVSSIFILSLTLLTLIALQFGDKLKADTVRMVAIIFQIGVVAMLAPSVSSGLLTDEITSGTLTALRLTPLKPYTVIFGKLKATFFYAMIFIVSSLFVLLAMAYLEHQTVFADESVLSGAFWADLRPKLTNVEWWGQFWSTYQRVFVWIGILLLSTLTFLTTGLFSSAIAKTTGIATAIAYSLTAIICLVSFAPLVLGDRLSHNLAFYILSLNPIAGAMQITSDNSFSQFPNLWVNNLMFLLGLSCLFVFASVLRTWYLFRRQE